MGGTRRDACGRIPPRSRFLIEDGTDRILGAHILGPNAEEVVNLFGAAIRLGLTAAQLRRVVPVYPSDGANLAYMLG